MFEALNQLGSPGYILLIALILALSNAAVNRRQDEQLRSLASRNSVCVLDITLALHEHKLLKKEQLESIRECIVSPIEGEKPALADIVIDKIL